MYSAPVQCLQFRVHGGSYAHHAMAAISLEHLSSQLTVFRLGNQTERGLALLSNYAQGA